MPLYGISVITEIVQELDLASKKNLLVTLLLSLFSEILELRRVV